MFKLSELLSRGLKQLVDNRGMYTVLTGFAITASCFGVPFALNWLSYIGTRLRFIEWGVLVLDRVASPLPEINEGDHGPLLVQRLRGLLGPTADWLATGAYAAAVKRPAIAAVAVGLTWYSGLGLMLANSAATTLGVQFFGMQEIVMLATSTAMFSTMRWLVAKVDDMGYPITRTLHLRTDFFADVNRYLTGATVIRASGLSFLISERAYKWAAGSALTILYGLLREGNLGEWRQRETETLKKELEYLRQINGVKNRLSEEQYAAKISTIKQQLGISRMEGKTLIELPPLSRAGSVWSAVVGYTPEVGFGIFRAVMIGRFTPFLAWNALLCALGNGVGINTADHPLEKMRQEVKLLRRATGYLHETVDELQKHRNAWELQAPTPESLTRQVSPTMQPAAAPAGHSLHEDGFMLPSSLLVDAGKGETVAGVVTRSMARAAKRTADIVLDSAKKGFINGGMGKLGQKEGARVKVVGARTWGTSIPQRLDFNTAATTAGPIR
jgi:hypothetical protein